MELGQTGSTSGKNAATEGGSILFIKPFRWQFALHAMAATSSGDDAQFNLEIQPPPITASRRERRGQTATTKQRVARAVKIRFVACSRVEIDFCAIASRPDWATLTVDNGSSARGNTMLVLSRNIGEALIIGDNICVTVLKISGDQVRLGIAAPEHISVHREEVYRRIHAEQRQAAGPQ
jgi:carbon storage regulator